MIGWYKADVKHTLSTECALNEFYNLTVDFWCGILSFIVYIKKTILLSHFL